MPFTGGKLLSLVVKRFSLTFPTFLLVLVAASSSSAAATGFYLQAVRSQTPEVITIPASSEFVRDGDVFAFARPERPENALATREKTFNDSTWLAAFEATPGESAVPTPAQEPFWLTLQSSGPGGTAFRVTVDESFVSRDAYELDLVLGGGYEVLDWKGTRWVVGVASELSRDERAAQVDFRAGVFQEVTWSPTEAIAFRGNVAGFVDPESDSLRDYQVRAALEGSLYEALTFGVLFAHEQQTDLFAESARAESRVSTRIGYRF